MASRDWSRLARYVRERREELGLTQEEVATRGGPSTATLRLIEGGESGIAFRPKSLRQLSEALGWSADSATAILSGREPAVATAPASNGTAPPPANPLPFPAPSDPAARAEWATFVAAVRDQVEAARSAAAEATDPTVAPEPPAEAVFPGDQPAQAIWSRRELPDTERMRAIATVRWLIANRVIPEIAPGDARGFHVEKGPSGS